MGTMREEITAAMLRSFILAQQELQAQWETDLAARIGQPPVWRWSPGTFVFPEALCCYCGGVMRSATIWRAEGRQFLGSWKVVSDGDGLGHFDIDHSHPHVNGGSICMGSSDYKATSVADALFMSFNPLSSYFGGGTGPLPLDEGHSTNDQIKAWLADRFDHVCGEGTNVSYAEGVDNRHLLAPEEDCHCHHCRRHRNEVQCPRETCRKWFSPKTGHGRFKCNCCGERLRFCIKHKHEIHMCGRCAGKYDLYDVNIGGPVAEPSIKQCGCGVWICAYCVERHARRCEQAKETLQGMAPRPSLATEVEHCDGCCLMVDDDNAECEGICEDCGHCDCQC